ncbi:MAG: hypothetical protein GQ582_00195 [Methyloprofundus sp.]|nr:hypothetical protein [Methyloprofundus sp.]
MPHSQILLRVSMLAFALISYLMISLSSGALNALLQVALELIIVISFAALSLSITHNMQRFMQTICALVGTDALLSLFAMPVIATLHIDSTHTLAAIALLALMLWNWLVSAHIIRHAINSSFSFALGLVFLYIFSASQIIGVLFPPISASS